MKYIIDIRVPFPCADGQQYQAKRKVLNRLKNRRTVWIWKEALETDELFVAIYELQRARPFRFPICRLRAVRV